MSLYLSPIVITPLPDSSSTKACFLLLIEKDDLVLNVSGDQKNNSFALQYFSTKNVMMTLSYFISNRFKLFPKKISGSWNTKLMHHTNDHANGYFKMRRWQREVWKKCLENKIYCCLWILVNKYPALKLWFSVGWGMGKQKGKNSLWYVLLTSEIWKTWNPEYPWRERSPILNA